MVKIGIYTHCLAVFLLICFSADILSAAEPETWRASISNGDKTGIGLELTRTGDSVTGTIYILDPNKPGDFSAGVPFPLKLQKVSETEFRFSVTWKPGGIPEDMVLFLNAPLKEKELRGTLRDADKKGVPREYLFVRTK